jgi:hypothetical protein
LGETISQALMQCNCIHDSCRRKVIMSYLRKVEMSY